MSFFFGGKPFFRNGGDGLGIKRIKNYQYVYDLWDDEPGKLCEAIKNVKGDMTQKKSLSGFTSDRKYLADLLKHLKMVVFRPVILAEKLPFLC